jgi:hypothetical protein
MKKINITVDLTKDKEIVWEQINEASKKLAPKKSWLKRIISWF